METKKSTHHLISDPTAYEGSILDFRKVKGKSVKERYEPIHNWVVSRQIEGNWPFFRTFKRSFDSSILFSGAEDENINLGSQDYLGLGQNLDVLEAGIYSAKTFGFHSAGSPSLTGRTHISSAREQEISEKLGTEKTILFSAGWMACFAAVAGTVTIKDHIILDEFAHNCLQVAAKFSTPNLHKIKHNSAEDLKLRLSHIRENDKENAIFIVIEGLYSMHSDSPNIISFLELANEYEAIIILDVAHDFGSIGTNGLGILENLESIPQEKMIICGSFSKTFASTGGFVSGSRFLETQISLNSNTSVFSNAISQFQSGIIKKSLDIAFSEKGKKLRTDLIEKSKYVREQLSAIGIKVWGVPSAIIPIEIDSPKKARLMAKIFANSGIILNLVEFPAVPRSIGLFRFQISTEFSYEFIDKAILKIAEAWHNANLYVEENEI